MKCQRVTIIAGKVGESGEGNSTSVWKQNCVPCRGGGSVGEVNIRERGETP